MRRLSVHCIILAAVLLGASGSAGAEDPRENAESPQELALRVFLDRFSYSQYVKEEIPFVNYVRDREQSQLHIMYSTRSTGARSTEHTVIFIGLREFEGLNDTLTYFTRDDDTTDFRRSELVRITKLGLMRYISKTPQAERIRIAYAGASRPATVTDRWDYWVFSLGASGSIGGQESYKDLSISGNVTADRVTEALKLNFSIQSYYEKNEIEYGDFSYEDISESHYFYGLAVISVSDHLSVGAYGSASQSVYYNLDLTYEISPAIEYDVFPYAESTHRDFRIFYTIGYKHNDYTEETIYFETEEDLFAHSLSVDYDTKAPWGSARVSLEASSYLHDFDLHSLLFGGSLSFRLIEGLSFQVNGSYSAVHDQIELMRGAATEEEVLLRRKQLATDYRYNITAGFRYYFGSRYSNVINPRF